MNSLGTHADEDCSVRLDEGWFACVSLSDDEWSSKVHTCSVEGWSCSSPVGGQHTHAVLER